MERAMPPASSDGAAESSPFETPPVSSYPLSAAEKTAIRDVQAMHSADDAALGSNDDE